MGYFSDKAMDAAARAAQMKQEMKGRTPEQKSVIKYFYGANGCLAKGLTDDAYDAMVKAKVEALGFPAKALAKLGVDESEVNEITPVHFEGYNYDKSYALMGKDGKWRSSAYEITWIFFSDKQVFVYKYLFNMDEDGKKETTYEYFYKDVTNFTTVSDSVEKTVLDKVSCTGKASFKRTTVDTDIFKIIVPGDSFTCYMSQDDYSESAVQGMKAKLREKKG